MSDPIPPRHGEDEQWGASEPVPVCPQCGVMVRSALSSNHLERGPYRCDLHGQVVPQWMYPDEEEV
jgi:hypothetical protein